MVLESLLNTKKEGAYARLFFIGAVYSAVAAFLASWVFRNYVSLVMIAFTAVFVIGISFLFGFIIFKLSRKNIKGEFKNDRSILTVYITLPLLMLCLIIIAFQRPKISPVDTIQNGNIMNSTESTIFISTLPPMAEVYMDDSYIGKTNIEKLKVSSGIHQMTFIWDSVRLDTVMTFMEGENASMLIRLINQ